MTFVIPIYKKKKPAIILKPASSNLVPLPLNLISSSDQQLSILVASDGHVAWKRRLEESIGKSARVGLTQAKAGITTHANGVHPNVVLVK